MARKLTFALSLLVLVGLMSGFSFASAIQITLGPSTSGSITFSPTLVSFSAVSGFALQGGGLGLGTFGFLNGNIPITNVNGPTSNLAVNSEPITVSIGSDVLDGSFNLASFTQITPQIAIFVGNFTVTGATSGFASSGFPVGSTSVADFVTFNGSLSSGELVPTPEPATFALVGSGLLAAAGFLRRKL